MAKTQIKQEKKQGGSKGSEKLTGEGPVPAVVEEILGRAGTRGEISQVKCQILQGKNYFYIYPLIYLHQIVS